MTARRSIDDLLAEARARLDRVDPEDALAEVDEGAVLVDIRSESHMARDGLLPGAVVIARNALEWRCDPDCDARDPRLADTGLRLILVCDEGYQSSLAAATLRRFGMHAADVIGGFRAWRAAGLPVER
jgi:rhodanese-related sulfurtransferase